MSFERKIRALLAGAAAPAECKDARAAWVRRTGAAWREAHRAMDDRLGAAVGRMSEADFERLCDAEMAKVDAMMASCGRRLDEDRWPRELYVGGI